jgi:predicted nucleotidyltransferase
MMLARINVPEAEIADFCVRNGIRRLAFFGSILTNRFSDSSDIDILVEFQPKERVGFFRLAEMEAELSRILGGRRVDLRTPMDLSRHFRDDVLGTAVPVYAQFPG